MSSDLATTVNETRLVRVMNWSELQIEPVSPVAYAMLCGYITTVTVMALVANGSFIVTTFKSKVSAERSISIAIYFAFRQYTVHQFSVRIFHY